MTLAIVCTLTLFGQALRAVDFFPLATGTKWTYTDTSLPGTVETLEAKAPVPVGRNDQTQKMATPVVLKQEGRDPQILYYRSDPTHILLVALDRADSPLESPEIVLMTGDGPQVWQDERNTGASIDPRGLGIVAKSEHKPDKNVFGAVRHILEVTFDAKVDGKNGVWIHQVATYASGVGLVEMKEVTNTGKKEYKRTQTLVKYEAAPDSGGA